MTKKDYEYCRPWNAGLSSTTQAVGNRLGRLLDALADEINAHVVEGEIVEEVFNLRWQMIDKLEKSGWVITIPKNRYIVKRKASAKVSA